MIDIHAHILPGIDDGAKNWDTCLDMLQMSAENGVKKIIATPHYLPWKRRAKPNEIENLCREAEKKLRDKRGISIDIYPGNEIYYRVDVIQRLREGKVLTLAGSRYALVEFDTEASYQIFCRAVKEFRDSGYIPIVAHMERYTCLRLPERVDELKEMGALFQMNVEAMQGGIFKADSRWAKKCLLKGQVDFLASDMHDMKKRPPIATEKLQWIQKKLEPEYQKELTYGNAQMILDSIEV